MKESEMIVIGISGPSGSGKTTLCNKLTQHLPNCTLIQQDWYFVDPSMIKPNSNLLDLQYIHKEEFVSDVLGLIAGKPVDVPVMDFSTFRRKEYKRTLLPGSFLLIEGMSIYRIPELYVYFDHRFFLSPDFAILQERKINRDLQDRGKSKETIKSQLEWVDREYKHDLETLSSDICFVTNNGIIDNVVSTITEQICFPILAQ
jgi:uridine kinase